MTVEYKCPICDKPFVYISNGKCPHCDKPLKDEWLGKETFKSSSYNHKSKLKNIVNPILRKLQFWTKEPYVIASIVECVDRKGKYDMNAVEATYVFYKYTLKRVRYFKTTQERDIWYADKLLEVPKNDNGTT